MRGLLLSAYDAGSHQHWRRGLLEWVSAEWTVLNLPPRHFRWRIRGNPLSWFQEVNELLERQQFDFLLCTSMVDLSALRGLCPKLVQIPNYVYFHENQFSYPMRDGKVDANLAILNLYTALAADQVVFNSEYNRQSMLDGIETFLATMPDCVPSDVREVVEQKSMVLPVGIQQYCLGSAPRRVDGPIHLIWNHRWEYDKAPERLFHALDVLESREVSFMVDVVGQRFRAVPDCFEEGRLRWAHRIRHWGFLETTDYQQALSEADVVVSTAIHEFQGLSVLNGMAHGCMPIVPDRLAYVETVPKQWRYESFLEEPLREAGALVDCLLRATKSLPNKSVVQGFAAPYFWSALASKYRELLINGGGL